MRHLAQLEARYAFLGQLASGPPKLRDAYARTGDLERAARYFAPAAQFSTTPETLYNYANYLKLAGKKGWRVPTMASLCA